MIRVRWFLAGFAVATALLLILAETLGDAPAVRAAARCEP